MLKISTASIFRLIAIAAIGLAVVNWWPRSTTPARDGSTARYHGVWRQPSYFKVTGQDSFGCKFEIDLDALPGYSLMTGTYPDGTLREKTNVFVTGHVGGCDIDRRDVTQGTYYSPDGTEIGRVQNGTGNIKYCQPNGTPLREFILESGKLVLERNWFNDGTLQSERSYLNGKMHGVSIDYHPNGMLRSRSTYDRNLAVNGIWYDQRGAEVNRFPKN